MRVGADMGGEMRMIMVIGCKTTMAAIQQPRLASTPRGAEVALGVEVDHLAWGSAHEV